MARRALYRLMLRILLPLCLLAAGGAFYLRGGVTAPVEPWRMEYYRGAYLVKQLVPEAAREPVDFPRRIQYDDTVDALLHHEDERFVLRETIRRLLQVAGNEPQARLFASYAFEMVAEPHNAFYQLRKYVAETAFEERHYQRLCAQSRETGDAAMQYLVATEWKEQQGACSEAQTLCLWSAMYRLGKHADALRLTDADAACLGWKGQVYAAKSLQALDEYEAALARLQENLHHYPGYAQEQNRLWLYLQPSESP